MRKSMFGRRIASLCLALTLLLSAVPFVGAITQSDIDAMKSQQADLQGEISSVQSQISELERREDTALDQALLYQEQIALLTEQISDTESLIADYEVQIADTEEDLAAAQAKSEEYYQLFCERVRNMEEAGEVSYWSILFNASSFSDLLDRFNFIREVVNYDNSVVDGLEEARQEVADTEAKLEEEKAGQEDALEELEQQEEAIEDASVRNEQLIAEIQANENTYSAQLAQLESENSALEADIVASEAEYQAQLEELARQAAAEEAARKAAAEKAAAEKAAAAAAAAANSSSSGSSSSSDSSSSSASTSSSGSSSASVSVSGSGSGVAVANYACQFIGNPYRWGGTSLTSGCDCSGFVMSVYAHFGVSLPHSSHAQAVSGTSVSYSNAQPGDIIYYNSGSSPSGGHVGIYIGGGQMVNAASASTGICISTVNPNRSGFTVRRIFN